MAEPFRLNGVLLTDAARGWITEKATRVTPEILPRTTDMPNPGRDGNTQVPATLAPPVLPFSSVLPAATIDDFYLLLAQSPLVLTRDDRPTWSAAVELLGGTPEEMTPGAGLVKLGYLLRINGVYWRDISTTDEAFAVGSGVTNANILSGTYGPVRDALVRISGGFTSAKLECGSSFFLYTGSVPTTGAVLVDLAAETAFLLTSTTAWTGGTDVTGNLTSGPGEYLLDLRPTFAAPPVVPVKVTLAGVTGSPQVSVRARKAYAV